MKIPSMLRGALAAPNRVRRAIGAVVLVAYAAGCTHTVTGEKAFKSFDECVSSNLALAGIGGIGIGILSANLVKRVGGDRGTANRVGVAAGIGASVMIGISAWRKCAAVYNTSEVVAAAPPPPAPSAAPPSRRAGVTLNRLDVAVPGTENDPPVPEFDFSYFAADSATKDIKAKLRHKVEIVRFKSGDNDHLFLVDANDDFLRDGSGRPIPLERANAMPRDQLTWIAIAEEGKNDYVEDIVIQQGTSARYRHKLQIPSREQLPLPLPVPMRYSLAVEVGPTSAARSVDFAILRSSERPRRFSSQAPVATPVSPAPLPAPMPPRAAEAPSAAPVSPSPAAPPTAAPSAPAPVLMSARRATNLFNDLTPRRRSVGRLAAKAIVSVQEEGELTVNGRKVPWVRVTQEKGPGGWVVKSDLVDAK